MRTRRLLAICSLLVGVFGAVAVADIAAPRPAAADTCYTWTRTLRQGSTGSDVKVLQIRVAGWVGYQEVLAVDGAYGARTTAAVKRFQSAYGLSADGVAGPQTFAKLYELQDSDCTPAHFSWSEFDSCQGGFSGGAVDSGTVQSNLMRVMWKLEALRKKLGDRPLVVASGFRSYTCNTGVPKSQHLYGMAADLVSSYVSLCTIAQQARYAGFSGIFGPGYPGHSDHTHVDLRAENNDDGITNGFTWSASQCGI